MARSNRCRCACGRARPQIIEREANQLYYDILNAFERESEYARLPRHAKVVEQRQVIEAKRAASAIEMIAIADANIAIGHITPRF